MLATFLLLLSNLHGCIDSAHDWHLHVHQDQVERLVFQLKSSRLTRQIPAYALLHRLRLADRWSLFRSGACDSSPR